MPRKYRKAPLQEALVEVRLEQTQPWDASLPGLFWEGVRKDLPKKRTVDVMELKFELGKEEVTRELGKKEVRLQCLTDDESRIVQIGPHLFVANFIGDYQAWDTARPWAIAKFQAFHKLAENRPIAQVALRYINKIAIPGAGFRWEDYFKIGINVPGSNPDMDHVALERSQPISKPEGRFRTMFRSDTSTDKAAQFILDLECTSLPGRRLASDQIADWLDRAHDTIESVFDACFTQKAHDEIFEEVH